MKFDLTEQQQMIKDNARDFLEKECPLSLVKDMAKDEKGHSPELWQKIAQQDWLAMPFQREYGGLGGDFLDAVLILEEMGRACFSGPFFSSVVMAGTLITNAGNQKQKLELLSAIAGGKLITTVALTEAEGMYGSRDIHAAAEKKGDGYIINGTKLFVPAAHLSGYIICVARTNSGADGHGISMLLVESKSPGVNTTVLPTIARDKLCEVVFDSVTVPAENILGTPDEGWPHIELMLQKAAVGKCAEMLGGAQRVLEMCVDYTKQRVQFGRPIGSFQAVHHHMADMAANVYACSPVTHKAAWKLSQGLPCAADVSIAKAWVSEAFRQVVSSAHRLYGGIGFTEECDLHLYYRAAKAAEVMFGDSVFHQELLAHEMGLPSDFA